jgi:RNA polymerase primary sigma factor
MDDDALSFDDPVKVYLREVCSVPPLSEGEEIDLYRVIRTRDKQADLAEKRLAEANLGLVVSIAKQHGNNRAHILDLIIAGNNGLFHALQTFSYSPNASFSAHAASAIELAITEAVAGTDSTSG